MEKISLVMVLHEARANVTGGLGADVVAGAAASGFDYLDVPPVPSGPPDVRVPGASSFPAELRG